MYAYRPYVIKEKINKDKGERVQHYVCPLLKK